MWPKVTVWNIKQYENCCSFSIFKSNLKTKTNLKILLNNYTFFYFKINPSDLHYCTVLIEVPPSPYESFQCAFSDLLLDLLEDIFSNVYSKREAAELSDLQDHINSQLGTVTAEPVCKEWNQSNYILTYKYNMGFDSLIKALSAYFAHFKIFTELN